MCRSGASLVLQPLERILVACVGTCTKRPILPPAATTVPKGSYGETICRHLTIRNARMPTYVPPLLFLSLLACQAWSAIGQQIYTSFPTGQVAVIAPGKAGQGNPVIAVNAGGVRVITPQPAAQTQVAGPYQAPPVIILRPQGPGGVQPQPGAQAGAQAGAVGTGFGAAAAGAQAGAATGGAAGAAQPPTGAVQPQAQPGALGPQPAAGVQPGVQPAAGTTPPAGGAPPAGPAAAGGDEGNEGNNDEGGTPPAGGAAQPAGGAAQPARGTTPPGGAAGGATQPAGGAARPVGGAAGTVPAQTPPATGRKLLQPPRL